MLSLSRCNFDSGAKTMTFKKRFLILNLLICTILFTSCNYFKNKNAPKEVERTPSEKKKAKLLKKIDRKFEDSQSHYELGQLYQVDRLWPQAEYEYNTALGFDPVHRPAQAALIKVLKLSGNTAKSELSADFFINQATSSASSSLQLALAFQKEELDDYALTCYQQAMRLAPNSARINRQMGYYYLSKGDKDRARDYLSRSFQLDRNQPEVAMELGRLGIPVQRPQKTKQRTKSLDKIIDEADRQRQP